MVTNPTRLDSVYGALADATRRGILAHLARSDASVGELAEPFSISRPAISKHLRVLEKAGLVQRTPEGRVSRCRLDARPMQAAAEWMNEYEVFWEGHLDRLVEHFAKGNKQKKEEGQPTDTTTKEQS